MSAKTTTSDQFKLNRMQQQVGSAAVSRQTSLAKYSRI